MFPAGCFSQTKYVAQGLDKWYSMRLELSLISSFNVSFPFRCGFYIEFILFFFL